MEAASFPIIFTAFLQIQEYVFLTFIHSWTHVSAVAENCISMRSQKQWTVCDFISYSPWMYLMNGWNPDICCDVWLTKGVSRVYWICSQPRFSTPCEMKIGNSLSKLNCWSRGGFSINWRLLKEGIGLRVIIYLWLKDRGLNCTKQPSIGPDSHRRHYILFLGHKEVRKVKVHLSFILSYEILDFSICPANLKETGTAFYDSWFLQAACC